MILVGGMYNGDVGDYVLVARRPPGQPEKAALQWTGPHRVRLVPSAHLVETEHLVTGDTRVVHIQRVRLYADQHLHITTELRAQVEHDELGTYVVANFVAWREHNQQWQLFVHWQGFDHEDDTWEDLSVLYEEVPGQVLAFLNARLPHPGAEHEGTHCWHRRQG